MNNRKYSLSTMLDVDDFLMERTSAPFKSFLTQFQPKEKGRLLATFSFVILLQNRSVFQCERVDLSIGDDMSESAPSSDELSHQDVTYFL